MKELSLSKDKTFSEFKRDFYRRFPDLSVFNCGEFNLLKVVLDGLKVDYVSRFRTFMFLDYPLAWIRAYFYLKGFFVDPERRGKYLSSLEKISDKKLILRSGYFSDEKQRRFNGIFDVFFSTLPEDSFACISGDLNPVAEVKMEFNVGQFRRELLFGSPWNKTELKLLREVKQWYASWCRKENVSLLDRKNIGYALQKFILDFRVWNQIFSATKAKNFVFRCHYHFEGAILAAKKRGIRTIELQHGLIAEEDIFYLLPESARGVAARAMFADEIWVYGSAWKNKLLSGVEYKSEQIKVFGYYPTINLTEGSDLKHILQVKGNRKLLVIATQTYLHKDFMAYVRWLKSDLSDKGLWNRYLIVLKPHPNEKKDTYLELEEEDHLIVYRGALDALLSRTNLLISAYSTVLVDAIRYNIPGFSIFIDQCSDYIEAFVREGYSTLLKEHENPIDKLKFWTQKHNAASFFAPMDHSLIKQLSE